MQLAYLVEKISYTLVQGSLNTEINDIAQDSRCARTSDVFVCIVGMNTDGHDFVEEVIEQGVSVIVTQKDIKAPKFVTVLKTQDTREAIAYMSCAYFGYPAEKLKTIAITGTKGKTTTCYMVKEILEKAVIKTGLIGTIEILIGKERIEAVNTTPEAYSLQKYLRKMVDEGCLAVVMEASSQAFKLKRIAGILFDYGAFLNISPDHIGLGEHSSFEEYLECKGMLFKQCRRGIINMDDSHYKEVIKNHTCKIETFSIKASEGDLRARNISFYHQTEELGLRFQAVGNMNIDVKIHMPGEFNVYNALCTMAIVKHFDVNVKDITSVMEKITIKGRMEFFKTNRGYHILIDYAHNATSLQHLLNTLRLYHPKRLVCLFGCGGNRSKFRRYEMGKVAAELADFTVVTSDNPRNEKPEEIVLDIAKSMNESDGLYTVIVDRREAIRYCLENAKEGDVIVLAGKGHEIYQEIKGKKYPMDEREILKEILKEGCV